MLKAPPKQRKSGKPARKEAADAWITPALRPLAVPIDSVKLDPDNARRHPEYNVRKIRESIQRFGQQKPVVCDRKRVVRAGNGTLDAARALGKTVIAAVFSELTPQEISAYAIADNRTGELSEWNEDKLREALGSLPEDLRSAAGWEGDDLRKALCNESRGIDAPNEAPPNSKPETAPGDLWTLGDHQLLCGSATDEASWKRLLGTSRGHLVYTDPPYGVSYSGGTGEHRGDVIKGDELRDDALCLKLLIPAFKHLAKYTEQDAGWYIWHASSTRRDFEHAMAAAGLIEKQTIIWAKPSGGLGHADYQWAHEPCFYAERQGHTAKFYGDRTGVTVWRVGFDLKNEAAIPAGGGVLLLDGRGASLFLSTSVPKGKKLRKIRLDDQSRLALSAANTGGTIWEVSRDTQTIHPTQKPVELAKRAIENSSRAGELVLEPFAGSGSTLIAAEVTGRRCAATELDPRYCDGIVRRWQTHTGKKATRADAKGKGKPGIG